MTRRIALLAVLTVCGCSYYDYSAGGCDPSAPPCDGPLCGRSTTPDASWPGLDAAPPSSRLNAGRAVPCVVDGDCATLSVCVGAVCVSTPRGCATDADCDAGHVCDTRGTCVVATGCRDASDCAAGDICIENSCVPVSATCQFDVDCGPSRSCVDDACRPVCTSDATCTAGTACVDGTCRPATTCVYSADCIGGAHCVDGRCLDSCEATSDCGAAEVCAAPGVCRPDVTRHPFCSADTDCAAGSICVAGVCRIPCPPDGDVACQRADTSLVSCDLSASGQLLCYTAHQAAPECRSETDCSGGRSCVDAVCR